jgi:hypothetical protein
MDKKECEYLKNKLKWMKMNEKMDAKWMQNGKKWITNG